MPAALKKEGVGMRFRFAAVQQAVDAGVCQSVHEEGQEQRGLLRRFDGGRDTEDAL